MKISLNEIKKLVPAAAEIATEDLVKLIGARLVEVEETIDLSQKYQGIFVVKVVECEPIPDTHLHLCKIDNGTERIQVVCGAPNVRKDMNAVWIAPGYIVPQTFGGENFQLDVRKLRGFESHGMLAGLDELALGDDHSGIVEIDPAVTPGTSFAEVFDLNDTILDIENKSLTHRPDCFGLVGFAREVAGILGVPFHYDNYDLWAKEYERVLETYKHSSSGVMINVSLDFSVCPSYHALVFDYEKKPEGSKYLTADAVFLAKFDMHSISPIVDMTNIVMLISGQPLHAFDYDKFVAVGGTNEAKIGVRLAREGEKLVLLDDKEIDLNESDIVVTSNDLPVALAGAMGGKSTEIDDSTSRIIVELASFSLFNLRRTQMSHGIFSEAITRFTKGRPVGELESVEHFVAASFSTLGGKLVGKASETDPALFDGNGLRASIVEVSTAEVNQLLGTHYFDDEIIQTLENVEFSVERFDNDPDAVSSDAVLRVTAPVWRTDIHIKEDIIEEVGRLLGFDNVPLDLPKHAFIGTEKNALLELKSKIREILSGRVASHEVLTYSFVSRRLQEINLEDPEDSYKIINSISPELQCFRQSLVPSLLEKMRDNLKAGYQDFSLFELNQVSKKSFGKDEDNVPILKNHLAFATTGDYYTVKTALLALLSDLGIKATEFEKSNEEYPFLEPLHSATCHDFISLGEVKAKVLKSLKISESVSVFELDLDRLLEIIPDVSARMPELSRYPSVERDLTIKVAADLAFSSVIDPILSIFKANDLMIGLTPTSIYQKEGAETKNLSFHLRFMSAEKTLESPEISDIMEKVNQSVKEAVGAEIV